MATRSSQAPSVTSSASCPIPRPLSTAVMFSSHKRTCTRSSGEGNRASNLSNRALRSGSRGLVGYVIARFQVLLPYLTYSPSAVELPALDTASGGYRVRIFPPQKAIVDSRDLDGASPVPLFEAMQGVRADPDRTANPNITVEDRPAFDSNLLVVDFLKDEEFDRNPNSEDPPTVLCFEVANDVLRRIRFVLRAPQIKPLVPDRSPWRIDFLNDDGSPLDPSPPLARARVAGTFSWTVAVLNLAAWAEVAKPEAGAAPVWDELLLDAFSYLPSVESSIALAFSALEAFIDWCLAEHVAGGAMDRALYTWIAERDGFAKQPSVTEQFDALLKAVSGRSLKEDTRLWGTFVSLRKLRNNIVHTGEATLDRAPVDAVKASELVTGAREIIDWIEAGLPVEKRRRMFTGGSPVSMVKPISGRAPDTETTPTPSTGGDTGPTRDRDNSKTT